MANRATRFAVAAALAACAAVGCSSYRPVNEPLEQWDPLYGFRAEGAGRTRDPGEVLLVLAFSGGGTRAASFAYGVLQELRDTDVLIEGEERRMLDEVDGISSVSGGSFTSAYWALYGDRIFEDFEQRFLRKNVQGRLYLAMLRPRNWFRMFGTFFNRTEIAIEYYDENIFDETTFADLMASPQPRVNINATDLSIGEPFTFNQAQFDLICSDLMPFRVARAVAASSAVPGAFPPITLRNYAGECGYEEADWVEAALADRRGSRRRYHSAKNKRSYLDGSRRYIHLIDGGVSDNLGLRGTLDAVITSGGFYQRIEELEIDRPSHVVFVLVNAETERERSFDLTASAPRIGTVLGAVSGVQIKRYNFETIELLRSSLRDWAREAPPDREGDRTKTFFVELDFESVEDPERRAYFKNLPTSFNLKDSEVDDLIALGRGLLVSSPEWKDFLADLERTKGAEWSRSEGPPPTTE